MSKLHITRDGNVWRGQELIGRVRRDLSGSKWVADRNTGSSAQATFEPVPLKHQRRHDAVDALIRDIASHKADSQPHLIRIVNAVTDQVIGSYDPERYHFEPEADPKPVYVQRRRCDSCGNYETEDNAVRTTVIDWRTDHLCDRCEATFDWSDWYQAPNRTYIHN